MPLANPTENELLMWTNQFWRGVEHAARIGAHSVELGPHIEKAATTRLSLADGDLVTHANRRVTVRFNSRLPPDTVQSKKSG